MSLDSAVPSRSRRAMFAPPRVGRGQRTWFRRIVNSPFDEWELARGLIREVFKDDLKKNRDLEAALRDGSGKSVVIAVLNSALRVK